MAISPKFAGQKLVPGGTGNAALHTLEFGTSAAKRFAASTEP